MIYIHSFIVQYFYYLIEVISYTRYCSELWRGRIVPSSFMVLGKFNTLLTNYGTIFADHTIDYHKYNRKVISKLVKYQRDWKTVRILWLIIIEDWQSDMCFLKYGNGRRQNSTEYLRYVLRDRLHLRGWWIWPTKNLFTLSSFSGENSGRK